MGRQVCSRHPKFFFITVEMLLYDVNRSIYDVNNNKIDTNDFWLGMEGYQIVWQV